MCESIPFFLFYACAVAASGSGGAGPTVRVAVFVALTCDDVGPQRQSVLNATVEVAMSRTQHDCERHRWNVGVEFDVVDACLTQLSVTHLTSALEDTSSSYVAIAGPGLYHLCGVASALQRSRPVRLPHMFHHRRHRHHHHHYQRHQ